MKNNTISPLRRIAVTLVLTGVTALGAVSIAPAAFADDSVSVQPSVTAPADTSAVPADDSQGKDKSKSDVADKNQGDNSGVQSPAPAPVVVTPPPAVVYDKNGKPIKAPKVCSAKDLEDVAKKVDDATKKAASTLQLAAKAHQAAALVRAQESKMTASQVRLAELVANGLDLVGDKLAAQAQASIDKAAVKDCITMSVPTGRF